MNETEQKSIRARTREASRSDFTAQENLSKLGDELRMRRVG